MRKDTDLKIVTPSITHKVRVSVNMQKNIGFSHDKSCDRWIDYKTTPHSVFIVFSYKDQAQKEHIACGISQH